MRGPRYVYLGGAIQYADNPSGWRSEFPGLLVDDWVAVDPLLDTPQNLTHKQVVKHDFGLIMRCQAMIARVDIFSWGTGMEILFANQNRIPVILYKPDGLQDLGTWLLAHGDYKAENVSEVLTALSSIGQAIERRKVN